MFGGVYGGLLWWSVIHEPDEWVLHLFHNNYLTVAVDLGILLITNYKVLVIVLITCCLIAMLDVIQCECLPVRLYCHCT